MCVIILKERERFSMENRKIQRVNKFVFKFSREKFPCASHRWIEREPIQFVLFIIFRNAKNFLFIFLKHKKKIKTEINAFGKWFILRELQNLTIL